MTLCVSLKMYNNWNNNVCIQVNVNLLVCICVYVCLGILEIIETIWLISRVIYLDKGNQNNLSIVSG